MAHLAPACDRTVASRAEMAHLAPACDRTVASRAEMAHLAPACDRTVASGGAAHNAREAWRALNARLPCAKMRPNPPDEP
jgi:hypothetical protein